MHLSDLTPPATPASLAARTLAERYHSESMQNHVLRSWLWAEAFAAAEDRTEIDHELLYVSCSSADTYSSS